MRERGVVIPMRMSLSVRPEPSQIECAFSSNGKELSREQALLPCRQLLDAYHREINTVAAGLPVTGDHIQSMKSELRKMIPSTVVDFVRGEMNMKRAAGTLALEVMLNDPIELDPYPWELISDCGLLADQGIKAVVWRCAGALTVSRRPSYSVLLAGSASLDMPSTDAAAEIDSLEQVLREVDGIHPVPRPQITFAEFVSLLETVKPSVVHIITHGDINSFRFQKDKDASMGSRDIPAQELRGYLERTPVANLVVLNACYSAKARDGRAPVARQIAARSSAATVGISAEVPNIVGMNFSKAIFRALVSGDSLIVAFAAAVDAIRQGEKFATLWSTLVMYAHPGSNVVLFPTDPMGKVRLRLQELTRQLEQLGTDAETLPSSDTLRSPSGPPGVGTLKVRLAHIHDLIDELGTPELGGAELGRKHLLLVQQKRRISAELRKVPAMLDNLKGPRQSRERQVQYAGSVRRALSVMADDFVQLEREFSDTR